MISQSSLPIQNSTGSKPDISRRADKNPDSIGAAQAKPATSFTTQLKDNIINVYERSEAKIAVPDERSGVDRRRPASRQLSSPQSAPLPSAKNVTASYLYSTDQKINQAYARTVNIRPAIFSPPPEKGTLVDIWV
jgi:hypothetical protein